VGGAGYAYLGQWRKALLLMAWSLVLLAGDFVAATKGLQEEGVVRIWIFAAMVLTPLWFSLLLLGALDAWLLARTLKSGGSVGVRETRVPLVALLLGQSTSETQKG